MHNISMNKLPLDKRLAILSALVEGCSLRSTSRMVGVSINTVTKFLERAGQVLGEYQHRTLRNLTCKRVQVDEIWSFCGMREKNVPEEKKGQLGFGDVWTFTAICADSKLVPSWMVGHRDACFATQFLEDVASRLANRIQLTTDGHKIYLMAVGTAFGDNVDYSMLVKMYDSKLKEKLFPQTYSPGECCGAKRTSIIGNPDRAHVSTSYVERQNLTMRMQMRRFTRLTNAFSKKLANLEHMLAIHYMAYNFSRIHMTLKTTPAMKAGVVNRRWMLEDIVNLID